MEFHGGHLHRPDDAGKIGDAQLVGVPTRGELHPNSFYPWRRATGEPLLMHLVAVDPARESVQHAGPFPQRANDSVAHAQVVAREV